MHGCFLRAQASIDRLEITNQPIMLMKKLSIAALVGMQAIHSTFAFAAPAKLPSVEVMQGFPDVEKINVADYCAGKNVIIVGLPGAFTPT